jgi:hypothetical protein
VPAPDTVNPKINGTLDGCRSKVCTVPDWAPVIDVQLAVVLRHKITESPAGMYPRLHLYGMLVTDCSCESPLRAWPARKAHGAAFFDVEQHLLDGTLR